MGCHKCLLYTRMLMYLGVMATHITNMAVMLGSFSEESMKIKGVRDFYETQFFFFTCWNFIFQTAYAAFAFFCDFISLGNTEEKKPAAIATLTSFREKVFTIVVWPPALMVTTYFWSFYAYDRNLLYPDYFDAVVSPVSNHIMHTLITPIAFLELVLYPRRKPDCSAMRISCLLGLEILYVSTLYYIHYAKGIWIYPMFATLHANPVYLVMLLTFTAVYLTVLYYGQFCVSKTVLRCWEKIGQRFCKACRK